MTSLQEIGNSIRDCRLAKNLRMDDVARQANISRVTLTNIEKGKGGYSITALLDVLKILDLYMELGNLSSQNDRNRATRINTKLDKKINHFIVMCVEQYAESVNLPSEEVYKEMNQKGIIEYFRLEYEDISSALRLARFALSFVIAIPVSHLTAIAPFVIYLSSTNFFAYVMILLFIKSVIILSPYYLACSLHYCIGYIDNQKF